MNNATELLKRHVWCTIIIAATVSLSAIIVACSSDVSLVSHLSLTSAIVSIVLAIIVIVYMFLQDHRSSQNIAEMKDLVAQASRNISAQAGVIVNEAKSMKQIAEMMQAPSSDSVPATPPLKIEGALSFDISVYGSWGLLTLYSLAKSYKSKKAMSWFEISDSLYEEDETERDDIYYYGLGMIQNLKSFLGKDAVLWAPDEQTINKLPEGLMESVTTEIEKLIEKYKGRDNRLEGYRKIIDDYFDNL